MLPLAIELSTGDIDQAALAASAQCACFIVGLPGVVGGRPMSSYTYSPIFFYTLLAGRGYDISATADVAGDFKLDTAAESAGGVTSLVQNPNLTNYATPTVTGHAFADCGIRLVN